MNSGGGGGINMGGGINPGGNKDGLLGSRGSGGKGMGDDVSCNNGENVSPPFISSVTPKIIKIHD